MKVLILGDIVGRPGRRILRERLPEIKKRYLADLVIANGENSAGGNGITEKVAQELFISGIDFLTMGNHIWDNKDVFNFIDQESRMTRPANYPPETPGQGHQIIKVDNLDVGILNISGRTFMNPLDCPFRTADREIKKLKQYTNIIFVDFHAEATSEKIAMGLYLDGKVSAVVGTHTHVQTADNKILPKGTAYITDLGMTGPVNSILGVESDKIIEKFLTQLPVRFKVAKGPAQINGVVIDIDKMSGKAISIERINIKEI